MTGINDNAHEAADENHVYENDAAVAVLDGREMLGERREAAAEDA